MLNLKTDQIQEYSNSFIKNQILNDIFSMKIHEKSAEIHGKITYEIKNLHRRIADLGF